MGKLITVRRAKEEIKRLQDFIDLAESYEADRLEKLIIKEYAYTNSIAEVVRILADVELLETVNQLKIKTLNR